MENDGSCDDLKARSFRSEDYTSNRRLFLRSYPLQWEEEGEEEDKRGEKEVAVCKCSLKRKLVSVFRLEDGKLLLLRKIKNKVALYSVACNPAGNPLGFKKSSKDLLAV